MRGLRGAPLLAWRVYAGQADSGLAMSRFFTSPPRVYAEWLILQAMRGALLASAVGIGAAAVRNVTASLETLAYGHQRARLAQPSPAPGCGSARSNVACADTVPTSFALRRAQDFSEPVELSEALAGDVTIEAARPAIATMRR
jgi:hypothetical protein